MAADHPEVRGNGSGGLPSGPLPLVSLNDLLDEEATLEWDVEGLILRGERVLLCGEPGTMKSWLLQDLALALVAGVPWLDRFRVPAPRRVLYLDEEMHEPTWRHRLWRLSVDRVPGRDHPARQRFRLLAHQVLRFRDGALEALFEGVQRQGFDPDVLIVDSVRRVLDRQPRAETLTVECVKARAMPDRRRQQTRDRARTAILSALRPGERAGRLTGVRRGWWRLADPRP